MPGPIVLIQADVGYTVILSQSILLELLPPARLSGQTKYGGVPTRLDIDIKGYRVAEVLVHRLRAVLGNRNNKLIVYIFAEIFQGREAL